MNISRTSRKDGKSRFGVKWSVDGGRTRTQFFETEKEREAFRTKLKRKARKEGACFLNFSPEQAVLLNKALSMADGDPMNVLRAVEHWRERIALKSVTVGKAATLFLDEKYNLGRDENGVRAMRNVLQRFEKNAGEINVDDCTTEQAQAWICSMHYAPITLKNHAKTCSAFFNWCIERSYCKENIFKKVNTPTPTPSEPEFLTVNQTKRFFKVAINDFPEILAYLALRAFAGIRSSACSRIPFEDIDFKERGIKITAKNAKNNTRDYLQGHPDNLWEWLEYAKENAPEGFELTERMHRRRFQQIAEKANFQPPHNAFRHSFATYHVALHGDAGKTARMLTHRTDPHLLFKHYKGNASKTEAEKYFSIRPTDPFDCET